MTGPVPNMNTISAEDVAIVEPLQCEATGLSSRLARRSAVGRGATTTAACQAQDALRRRMIASSS